MKHTLKIILPIILILAIVIGACWFFLIARRDVTESIFVYWGEHFYEAGRYSRAVAFYKAAMRFAPKDAELAIRLALVRMASSVSSGRKKSFASGSLSQ